MKFEDLKGKTIKEIKISPDKECIEFHCENNETYRLMWHGDCCAECWIEDICGDLEDLIGHPLLVAEEVIHENTNPTEIPLLPDFQVTYTWTFYKLDTIKGGVTIRFFGTSNGYYSETATFGQLTENGWEDYYDREGK